MITNFTFGDIVIVEGNKIGVILKQWENGKTEVYVRSFNDTYVYDEKDIRRYLVRHKELNEEEMYYQNNMDGRI